jgi:hypothetical protein
MLFGSFLTENSMLNERIVSMAIVFAGTISKGWLAQALGIKFNYDYYFDPYHRHRIDAQCQEYTRVTFPDLAIIYSESNAGRAEYISSNQVLVGGIQPNMILGMLLGADFVPNDEFDPDISINCLKDAGPEDLPPVKSLLDHKIVKQFDEQILKIKSDTSSDLCVIPPFFWDNSGRIFLHGVMTSAQKFFGENIFVDMLADPERCHTIMAWMADAYIVLAEHFSQIAEFPITSVHVGECSSCMIDVDSFDQFVVPQTSQIGKALGPLRFHSCGCSTHLVKSVQQITNIVTLDTGGETSIADIREAFGNDFPVSIAPMAVDLSAKTSKPVLDWAQRIVEENGNGDLKIVYHLEPNYKLDILEDLNRYIKEAVA